MTAELNHTIVWCSDNKRSSRFLADILGRDPPRTFHHFEVIDLDNAVSIDFMVKESGPPAPQHYAFLVDDEAFDYGFGRIKALGLQFWADPARTRPGEINRNDGGRGVYFLDPDGHVLELLTTPYGVLKQ